MSTVSILGKSGDTKLTWNQDDPAEREAARQTVVALKAAGYTFYLLDGLPADEITAGSGTLVVRKLTAEEVVPEPVVWEMADHLPPTDSAACKKCGNPKHKGRCRLADIHAKTAGPHVAAVRPVAGG